jgi:RNA polymerase sigma-70 factor (ECF subfamily)
MPGCTFSVPARRSHEDASVNSEESLETLMRAANRGDGPSYERLLGRITPVLRGIVRQRGAALGPEGCEDVLQAILLAIHLKRHTWRDDLPLRPWLYAVARHKVIDALRARGIVSKVPVESIADELPAPEPVDPMQMHDIEKVLARLDRRSAQIVRAVGIEGATAAEAGQQFNMSEGAVRVALHRALKTIAQLRKRMFE